MASNALVITAVLAAIAIIGGSAIYLTTSDAPVFSQQRQASMPHFSTMDTLDNGIELVRLSPVEYREFIASHEQRCPRNLGSWDTYDPISGCGLILGLGYIGEPTPISAHYDFHDRVIDVNTSDFVKSDGRFIYVLRRA